MPTNDEKLACWRDGYALRDALQTIKLHIDFAVTTRTFDNEFWEQMLDDRADLDHYYHLAKQHGCLDGKQLDTSIRPILEGVTARENPVVLGNRVGGLLSGTIPVLGAANPPPKEGIELPQVRMGSRTVTPILTPISPEEEKWYAQHPPTVIDFDNLPPGGMDLTSPDGKYDAHISVLATKESRSGAGPNQLVVDIFDSHIKNHDKAHITSEEFNDDDEGRDEAADLLAGYGFDVTVE